MNNISIAVATVLLLCAPAWPQTTAVDLPATTSEGVLRKMATQKVKPEFPDDARRSHKTGVAVVEVKLSHVTGTVASVRLLESPSASIGDSVLHALSQWKFASIKGSRADLAAKLTFYFMVQKGKAVVLDPSEAPLYSDRK
jgi:TonB family protein